jgi:hypothetical protein
MLLFMGIETIHREDGVDIHNYRFHDIVNNETVLLDIGLTRYCEEIKGDSHECNKEQYEHAMKCLKEIQNRNPEIFSFNDSDGGDYE